MTDEDFKYLVKEFGSKNLGFSKQKGAYAYEYKISFERFKEKNCLLENLFIALQKTEKLVMMEKKSDGHKGLKDYLTCEKIWDKFDIKDMGDYHDHYLKKDVLLLADVFEKFIATCLTFCELDPFHYSVLLDSVVMRCKNIRH